MLYKYSLTNSEENNENSKNEEYQAHCSVRKSQQDDFSVFFFLFFLKLQPSQTADVKRFSCMQLTDFPQADQETQDSDSEHRTDQRKTQNTVEFQTRHLQTACKKINTGTTS